jgi:hypothetical protein
MEPSIIYAVIVSSLLFMLGLRQFVAIRFLHSRRLLTFVCTHLYPHLYRRRRFLQPVSRLGAILQLFYWAGTIIFNFIGVPSLAAGGSRAGSIAMFNFIPLCMADRLGFTADRLDLPLRTMMHIHQSAGVMAILQAVAHVILKYLSGEFKLHDSMTNMNFYGLMVCSPLNPGARADGVYCHRLLPRWLC